MFPNDKETPKLADLGQRLCRRTLCSTLTLILTLSCSAGAWGGDFTLRTDCPEDCNRLSDAPVSRTPFRVLLVPLLVRAKDSPENERWPERPAREIAAFYRTTNTQTLWLRDLQTWDDYYEQAEMVAAQYAPFDRVIFIGHGGYDGPILNAAVYQRHHDVQGNSGQLYRAIERQPGLRQTVTVTYSVSASPAFSRYVTDNWRKLSDEDIDIAAVLGDVETRLQPPDNACLRPCLASANIDAGVCESACRTPLFLTRTAEEIAEDRFARFVQSLRNLVQEDGLVVLGFCNSGSASFEPESPWHFGGMLLRSSLAGGPHGSYMQLLAAATGRAVAGAVGQTSAADIVRRVEALEQNQYQRYFRIVTSPDRFTPP